jgi:hypothetical protein
MMSQRSYGMRGLGPPSFRLQQFNPAMAGEMVVDGEKIE